MLKQSPLTPPPASPDFDRRLLQITVIPVALSGLVFELFLGHRHDYTGHFLAGFGASFAACLLWFKNQLPVNYRAATSRGVVPICLTCIVGGIITEATIFRIAKFDEIDFFNQSIGAVLALLCASAYIQSTKPIDSLFDRGLIIGIVILGIGAIYAVA